MNFYPTPLRQESPLIMNSATDTAYQCHRFIKAQLGVSHILISYKDKFGMINFAYYTQHEDGYIESFIEGVCPGKEDYEMIKSTFERKIMLLYPNDLKARLYRSSFCFTVLSEKTVFSTN